MASEHQKTEQPSECKQGTTGQKSKTDPMPDPSPDANDIHQRRRFSSDESIERTSEFDVASPISPSP